MHVPENWPPCQPLSLPPSKNAIATAAATTACMHQSREISSVALFKLACDSVNGGEGERKKERARERPDEKVREKGREKRKEKEREERMHLVRWFVLREGKIKSLNVL